MRHLLAVAEGDHSRLRAERLLKVRRAPVQAAACGGHPPARIARMMTMRMTASTLTAAKRTQAQSVRRLEMQLQAVVVIRLNLPSRRRRGAALTSVLLLLLVTLELVQVQEQVLVQQIALLQTDDRPLHHPLPAARSDEQPCADGGRRTHRWE